MLFFIFYFLFFISFTLCSQTPPVISYYLEALGGKSKLMAVRSAKVNSAGRFVSGIDTIKYTSQIFFQRPDKVHLKTKYTHGTKVKVFDGTDFWENALYGDINRLEGDELRMMLERYINFGIEDLIVNAKHYHQKRDTLVDHVEYSRCLVITMNGWELDCYFDPRSHLLSHYTFNNGFNTIRLSDYKRFDGLLFATQISGFDGEVLTSIVKVSDLALDVEMDSKLFTKNAFR